ncbi:tungsten formylmethanofuran dehydrogenase [Mesorhizobium sp. 1B3]|uniref:tungsten formylmethanofuran dehydrogenase n=1 Tax=Mesorhizobium sp. 1B3 TaxID=3243599 RepID=UPI003D989491
MAVAWIGNRETLLRRAVEHAAMLLRSSRCPVFSLDTDIHGVRAAIGLAERIGAACDHPRGASLAAETALFTDKGAMTVSPGEARGRADLLVLVGTMPEAYHAFLADLTNSVPDLAEKGGRNVFRVGRGRSKGLPWGGEAIQLFVANAGLAATLAALRAQCAGRQVTIPVSNFGRFAEALSVARFPVFVFSGYSADALALEMLQGLVADLNRRKRASTLHLTASENGWGGVLASTWMTGFPLRTGFARGFPEFDPWRFDAERMIAGGEADLHLWISGHVGGRPVRKNGTRTIALARTARAIPGAAVTIAIGEVGADHPGVVYSARTGGLVSLRAREESDLPTSAAIVHAIADLVSAELPC